ncbi:hypothetical protein LSAT2_008784 [Lamellibrachia satsuma]|nr:hypothetical protein LSAT2_008784 [Lamellibrachia satsuma]
MRTSPSEETTRWSTSPPQEFCVGEQVRVVSDESEVFRLQEERGGWNDKMRKCIGQIGTIKGKQEDVIEVQFSDGETWNINKALLQPCTEQIGQAREDSRPFERYDIVSLEKDKKTVMTLQKDHDGWTPSMTWLLGLNGVIRKVKENGDVFVEYSNDNTYWFNPNLLEVVDTSHMPIEVGDFVLVNHSAKKVKALQDENHGGWNEKMRKTMGSTGIVVGVLSNGRARVFISGHRWIYNVNALRHIARSGRPASNIAPSDDSPSSDSDAETDVLFYKRIDPPLASQRDTGSRVRPQTDLGWIFCEGNKVRVDSDESVAIRLQGDLVGWNDEMKQYLGKTGVVKCEQGNIVEVVFPDGENTFCHIPVSDVTSHKVGQCMLVGNSAELSLSNGWYINKALLQLCKEDSDIEEEDQDQDRPFKKYDIVSIERDKDTAEALQEGHGGYAPRMALVLGSRGYVLKVDRDGDVHVKCINQSKWLFNPKLLGLVDTSRMTIEIGDFVFVINSYATVKALQDEHHGGWQEEMRENWCNRFSTSDAVDKSCGRVLHSLKVVELSIVQSTEQSVAEIKAAQNKTAHRSMARLSRQQVTNSADQAQINAFEEICLIIFPMRAFLYQLDRYRLVREVLVEQ